jgi:hypothetical protein
MRIGIAESETINVGGGLARKSCRTKAVALGVDAILSNSGKQPPRG